MEFVKLGKAEFSVERLAAMTLEEAKKATAKNTPEELIEKFWNKVNKSKPKKSKPKPKPKKEEAEK